MSGTRRLPKLRVTDNGIYDRSFEWAGNDYLRADQQLYDPNFPLALWEYRGAEQSQTRDRQTWVSINTPTKYTFDHPPRSAHGLQPIVASAKANTERFALKPGDRVRIDVNGVPAERQAAAKAALETRLKEVGYVPDDSGT